MHEATLPAAACDAHCIMHTHLSAAWTIPSAGPAIEPSRGIYSDTLLSRVGVVSGRVRT